MRVGPMPITAADKLLRILNKSSLEGEILASAEVAEGNNDESSHPRIESTANLVYVEFDDSALDLLRPDLVRLALIDESVATGDELDGEDWVCPKCGKTFELPGMCDKHDLSLVTFEAYAAAKRTQPNTLDPMTVVIIVAIIGGVIYMITR
jgi:hypothetical protein